MSSWSRSAIKHALPVSTGLPIPFAGTKPKPCGRRLSLPPGCSPAWPAPELEARLIGLAPANLDKASPQRRQLLCRAYTQSRTPVLIGSAYALDEKQREQLLNILQTLLGQVPECCFERETALLSGLRIDIGSWRLRANLGRRAAKFCRSRA